MYVLGAKYFDYEFYGVYSSTCAEKARCRFRTTGRSTGTPHCMTQQDAYRLIERHAKHAGIKTRVGNHSMRATGITDYLKATARWQKHARWRTMPIRAPRNYKTGVRMWPPSMNTARWRF